VPDIVDVGCLNTPSTKFPATRDERIEGLMITDYRVALVAGMIGNANKAIPSLSQGDEFEIFIVTDDGRRISCSLG
jgi:hypothetical protein